MLTDGRTDRQTDGHTDKGECYGLHFRGTKKVILQVLKLKKTIMLIHTSCYCGKSFGRGMCRRRSYLQSDNLWQQQHGIGQSSIEMCTSLLKYI